MPSLHESNSLSLSYPKRDKQLDGTYYHISLNPVLGNTVNFFPRVPLESSPTELDVPRICFSPSVSQCIMAISHKLFDNDTFYIYKSDIEVYQPVGVGDAEITKEVWALAPVWLHKVGVISKRSFYGIGWDRFKIIVRESYFSCWPISGFDLKNGFLHLNRIRDFLKECGIKDYP
jgi:hypothetical protein